MRLAWASFPSGALNICLHAPLRVRKVCCNEIVNVGAHNECILLEPDPALCFVMGGGNDGVVIERANMSVLIYRGACISSFQQAVVFGTDFHYIIDRQYHIISTPI